MKKINLFIMLIIFSAAFSMVYAAGSGESEKPEKEIVWKMSHVEPIDSSMVKATQDYILKEITERTDGMLKFEIYPDSVLGNNKLSTARYSGNGQYFIGDSGSLYR